MTNRHIDTIEQQYICCIPDDPYKNIYVKKILQKDFNHG